MTRTEYLIAQTIEDVTKGNIGTYPGELTIRYNQHVIEEGPRLFTSYLKACDPTPTAKYARWLLPRYFDIEHEDHYRVRQALKLFDRYKHRLPYVFRDIMFYRDENDLWHVMDTHGISKLADTLPLDKAERLKAREESTVLLEIDGWIIVQPNTFFAAKWWGRGTRWCTTGSEGTFSNYDSRFPLTIVIKGGEKYQFHNGHCCDAADQAYSYEKLWADAPEAVEATLQGIALQWHLAQMPKGQVGGGGIRTQSQFMGIMYEAMNEWASDMMMMSMYQPMSLAYTSLFRSSRDRVVVSSDILRRLTGDTEGMAPDAHVSTPSDILTRIEAARKEADRVTPLRMPWLHVVSDIAIPFLPVRLGGKVGSNARHVQLAEREKAEENRREAKIFVTPADRAEYEVRATWLAENPHYRVDISKEGVRIMDTRIEEANRFYDDAVKAILDLYKIGCKHDLAPRPEIVAKKDDALSALALQRSRKVDATLLGDYDNPLARLSAMSRAWKDDDWPDTVNNGLAINKELLAPIKYAKTKRKEMKPYQVLNQGHLRKSGIR